jgi:hypothetical protein
MTPSACMGCGVHRGSSALGEAQEGCQGAVLNSFASKESTLCTATKRDECNCSSRSLRLSNALKIKGAVFSIDYHIQRVLEPFGCCL